MKLEEIVNGIRPVSQEALRKAQAHLDNLTKPPGSLGRLEDLASRLVAIRGDARPLDKRLVVTMAADHGVAAEGVSAFPQAVTVQMVANFAHGGAGINVLARAAGAQVLVVDMGVAGKIDDALKGVLHRKIGFGTANMVEGPAMTRAQASAAIQAGVAIVKEASPRPDVMAIGEMGIANSTAAAAITAVLEGLPARGVTGRGTGVDDEGLDRKVHAIEKAIAVNKPNAEDPLDVLAKVGGFEIGGMAGVVLGAAALGIPVILDGYISSAAALIAARLAPESVGYMIASHRSVEQGHGHILRDLGLEPLLDLNLRLGEGTGAALALPLLDAACKIYSEMATFASAGVSGKESPITASTT